MTLSIAAALFITVFCFVAGSYLTYAAYRDPERKRVRRHLHDSPSRTSRRLTIDITRKRVLSDAPLLHRLLSTLSVMRALGRLVEQANSSHRLSFFLALSLVLGLTGLLVLQPPLDVVGGSALGLLPFAALYLQKQRRRQRFERQFPEALELVARALKAGHSFNVGMKMVSDEFPDPTGTEFARIVDEIQFGGGLREALESFSERFDCADLRFFVTAVMVQRETGGNLAEVIEKASGLIRQRFELLGRIRALSGEGKLSAIILIALPFFIGVATYVFNRDYLMILLTDPLGKWLIGAAVVFMLLGSLMIMRMVKITASGGR